MPRADHVSVILLKAHAVKLPSKCLCLYALAQSTLNDVREVSLCRRQPSTENA